MRALTLAELIYLNELREREKMAGEIRDAMAGLRKARQKMIADLMAEIGSVTTETAAVRDDGMEALKLPRAELAAHRAEIQEIRDEFAPLTNAGPDSPLAVSSPHTVPQGGRG